MENLEKKIKNEFKNLRDLSKEDLKNEIQGFYFFPCKMEKRLSKSGFEIVSIKILINKYLNIDLKMTNNQNQQVNLSVDRFNEILLNLGLPLIDEFGRDKKSWTFKVPCRFVKGKYENEELENEYLSLEVFFKQYLYQVYFLNKSQRNIVKKLIEMKDFDYKIVERENKVKKIEDQDDYNFDF